MKRTEYVYVIVDRRHEHKEGKPRFVAANYNACHSVHHALRFTNQKEAMKAYKGYAAGWEYESPEMWMSIRRIPQSRGILLSPE